MDILRGKLVTLRPMNPKEVKLIHKWANNPDIIPFWYGKRKTMKEIMDDWTPDYFSDTKPESGRCFAIELEGKPIGMINYNRIDEKNKRAEIDILIGDKANWNKGYGTDALKIFIKYLFNKFKINEIWLETKIKNNRAIRTYQKAGLKIENSDDKDIILSIRI